MISEKTYSYVKDEVISRLIDLIIVKGKTEPVAVYELIGLANDTISLQRMEFLRMYNRGLQCYRSRKWEEATQCFAKAVEMVPEDYPSFLYFRRANEFALSPPPSDWDGVYVLKTK